MQNKKRGEDTVKKVNVRRPRYSTDELKILIIQEEKDTIVPTTVSFLKPSNKVNVGTMLGD